MALHPDFPRSPYETLPPQLRWFPAAEELRGAACERLPPPRWRTKLHHAWPASDAGQVMRKLLRVNAGKVLV